MMRKSKASWTQKKLGNGLINRYDMCTYVYNAHDDHATVLHTAALALALVCVATPML